MEEASHKNATYCVIPFIGNAQNRQIRRKRKQSHVFLGGWGQEGMGGDSGDRVFGGRDENILKLNSATHTIAERERKKTH